MKKRSFAGLIALWFSLLAFGAVAQGEGLRLSLSRDWGYAGFGNDIQGLFSMRASGPDDLAQVDFYIDEIKIGGASEPPFRLQFTTDDYPVGEHRLYAVGTTSDGAVLRSNEIVVVFVAASEGGKAAFRIALPVLVIVFGAMLLSFLVPALLGRGKTHQLALGAERRYGLGGGAICPKCHRPFALPFLAPNLVFSKLARCPYCGKLSAVRVQSGQALKEAERAELDWARPGPGAVGSEEERLRKELDESKYRDL